MVAFLGKKNRSEFKRDFYIREKPGVRLGGYRWGGGGSWTKGRAGRDLVGTKRNLRFFLNSRDC